MRGKLFRCVFQFKIQDHLSFSKAPMVLETIAKNRENPEKYGFIKIVIPAKIREIFL